MFFGTFWEHHTCLYTYRVLIIKYLDAILCYSEEIIWKYCSLHFYIMVISDYFVSWSFACQSFMFIDRHQKYSFFVNKT